MAVMAREEWTDADLNQLSTQVDAGFEAMRMEFKAVRAEMQAGSEALRSEFKEEFQAVRGELRGEIAQVRNEIAQVRNEMVQLRSDMNAFHRSVIQLVWGIVGTVFLGFMGTIAALFSLV